MPLDELADDWEYFITSGKSFTSTDEVEMKKALLACRERWAARLEQVNAILSPNADHIALARSFKQYVAH